MGSAVSDWRGANLNCGAVVPQNCWMCYTRADRNKVTKMQSSLSTPANESNKTTRVRLNGLQSYDVIVRKNAVWFKHRAMLLKGGQCDAGIEKRKQGQATGSETKPCTEYELRQTLTVAPAQLVNGQQEKGREGKKKCIGKYRKRLQYSIRGLTESCEQASRVVLHLCTRKFVSFVPPP